jgi:hypothetical protein
LRAVLREIDAFNPEVRFSTRSVQVYSESTLDFNMYILKDLKAEPIDALN